MHFSKLLIPTLKEAPTEAQVVSHVDLIRGGYIRKLAAGIYSLLPLGVRVVRKIERIIREELDRVGCQEVLLPMVHPAELWQESGRWRVYGPELGRFQDRKGAWFTLAPTAEEAIIDLVRRNVRSYRQLPLNLYQIQDKFRDEMRPRAGLLRGRAFIMKDAYSFHVDEADAHREYQAMTNAYTRIFRRCGLDVRVAEAATGVIGGTRSHEFHVLTDAGEDALVSCDACGYTANVERAERGVPTSHDRTAAAAEGCRCGGRYRGFRGIEVGHVFFLGTQYAEPMRCTFLDKQGQERPMVMGCYGIGITRTVAAVIELNHDADGIVWPFEIAPFEVEIVAAGGEPKVTQVAEDLDRALDAGGIEVLLDDRDERPGVKFKDADLIGIPFRVTVGKKALAESVVELRPRRSVEVTPLPIAEAVVRIAETVRAARARAFRASFRAEIVTSRHVDRGAAE